MRIYLSLESFNVMVTQPIGSSNSRLVMVYKREREGIGKTNCDLL